MVEPRWAINCMNSTLDLLSLSSSYTDLKTLYKQQSKKYYCLCRRHTISVISINEWKKLYWFNCKNVREKVNYGLGEGYYHKLLRIINGALNTWAQYYIDGLSVARRDIMFKINGTAKKNMKLLKEGCYCHYHPHITADACNADFLKKVVSFWATVSPGRIRDKLRERLTTTYTIKKVETWVPLPRNHFFLFFRICFYLSPSLPLPLEFFLITLISLLLTFSPYFSFPFFGIFLPTENCIRCGTRRCNLGSMFGSSLLSRYISRDIIEIRNSPLYKFCTLERPTIRVIEYARGTSLEQCHDTHLHFI